MRQMLSALLVAWMFLTQVACTPVSTKPGPSTPDAGGGTELEEPRLPGTCTPVPGAVDRAVVAAVSVPEGADEISVYTLTGSGRMVDRGLRFTGGFANPRRVAMRPDGKEAVVAFGLLDGDVGIVVLALSPDGGSAERIQTLVVAQGQLPFALTYTSADHVLMASSGAQGSFFYPLERSADGKFVLATPSEVPGGFPVQLLSRPKSVDRALLVRSRLGVELASELMPIVRKDFGWTSGGTSARVLPPSLYAVMHPQGNRVYSGTDAVGAKAPTPAGQLYVFRYSGDDLIQDTVFPLENTAQAMAIAADARLLVAQVPVLERDSQTGQYRTRAYAFQTLALDEEGMPRGKPLLTSGSQPAFLFHSFELTSSNHLVVAMELYANQASSPQHVFPVKVFEQASPGQWTEVCETVWLPGYPSLAVAP
jgi:hypothetical protein